MSEKELYFYCTTPARIIKEATSMLSNTRNNYQMSPTQMSISLIDFYEYIFNSSKISLSSSNLGKYKKGFMMSRDLEYMEDR